jgi:hypothetical protein
MYSEGPATGHLGTDILDFPCLQAKAEVPPHILLRASRTALLHISNTQNMKAVGDTYTCIWPSKFGRKNRKQKPKLQKRKSEEYSKLHRREPSDKYQAWGKQNILNLSNAF